MPRVAAPKAPNESDPDEGGFAIPLDDPDETTGEHFERLEARLADDEARLGSSRSDSPRRRYGRRRAREPQGRALQAP